MNTDKIQNTTTKTANGTPLPLLINRTLNYFALTDHQAPLTINERKTAFIDGYLIALHKTRTYDHALFKTSMTTTEHKIYLDLKTKRDIDYVDSAYKCFTALTDSKEPEFQSSDPADYFLLGYCSALYVTGVYDDCLFLEGHALRTCVLAGILSLREKLDNARRAEGRKQTKHYTLSQEGSGHSDHASENIARLRQIAERGSIPAAITPILAQPDTSHLRRTIALEATKLGLTQLDDVNRFYHVDGTPASPEEIQKMREEAEATVNSTATLIPKSTHEAKTCRVFTMLNNDGRPLRVFVEQPIADYLDRLMEDAHNQPLSTDEII